MNTRKIETAIALLQEATVWAKVPVPEYEDDKRIKDRLIDALAIIKALLEEVTNA